ncbi:MAG: glycosyltransferase family 2 protein, partial [Acidimicrobiales bacterium]
MSTILPLVPLLTACWVVGITLAQLSILASAMYEHWRVSQRDEFQLWRRVLASPLAPKVSVLVPAYNEEVTVTETVRGLLALSYQNLEVVVINDGSPDSTVDVLIDAFDLRPVHPIYQRVIKTAEVRSIYRSHVEHGLVMVDKFNGGKADSLNAGLNIASGELVCAIDADTLVGPDALHELVAPFLNRSDTVAVGGTVRLTNDSVVKASAVPRLVVPKKIVPALQAVEYVRAFIVGRLGWNPMGGNLIISGAFGLFDRQSVLDAGGYETSSIGEDMELIVRLRRMGYERGSKAWVEFLPKPVAWTEAPDSLKVLGRQRNRWQRGLMDVLLRHKKMMFNPKYGSAGMLSMPYYFVVEFLSPIVEALGLITTVVGLALGFVQPQALWLILGAYGFGASMTIMTLWFDDRVNHAYPSLGSRAKLAFYGIFEQFFYRPLTIYWR